MNFIIEINKICKVLIIKLNIAENFMTKNSYRYFLSFISYL